MGGFLTADEVRERFTSPSWQHVVFAEFESTLTSRSRPFPCVFGVTGLKAGQLRFAFLDPLDPEETAPVLRDYLRAARGFGRMTSLVLFGRPGPVRGIDVYRDRFWNLLDGLARADTAPRPADVPEPLDTDLWEFCFDGEPVFVVCNTPAHVLRQSRRSTSFMVTFQPRWVFDGIMDEDDPAQARALRTVRERLRAFDAIEPAPFLGHYGAPGNREFRQYFIDDTNAAPGCPFHSLGQANGKTDNTKGKVA
jgi:FPC/CPF motif-containing protein YcgG